MCSLLFLTSCAQSDDSTPTPYYSTVISPANANQLLDLPYGDDPEQKMDLYLPANRVTNVTKVFIVVHGGGWFSGDKFDINNEVILLRATFPDCAIANVNYRLGTKESLGFPKQINDMQKVVAFLNAKSKEYHIGKQYAMIGVSAGAQLSMLYSYKYNTNNQVKAVCSIVGPADFSDPEYEGNRLFERGLNYLVGNYPTYSQNPALYDLISPAKQVSSKSPKTIMFYGDVDPLVPNTQGGILKAKLDAKHIYNEYYLYSGVGHADFSNDQWNDVNAKTVEFFKANFK